MDWMPLATIGFGLFQKHVLKRLPNNAIPWVNTAACIGTAFAAQASGNLDGGTAEAIKAGIAWSGIATLGHQVVKVPIKNKSGRSI